MSFPDEIPQGGSEDQSPALPPPPAPPAPPPRQHSLMSYLLVAIVGAIIGGLVVSIAVPSLYGTIYRSGPLGQLPDSPKFPLPPAEAPPSGSAGAPAAAPAVFVAQILEPAVVGIVNKLTGIDIFGRQASREASGSGVVFAMNGYVITNNHVVEGATELTVSLADGRKFTARVIGTDRPTDLAVIKVEADGLPSAQLGNSDELRVGDVAIAIGNPVGAEFQRSVTQGIISGVNRVLRVGDQTFKLIQTDAVINPGNSGGPLANTRGQVVGINTLKLDLPRVEGMGFAIPINVARPIVEQLIARGRVSRPYLGVYLIDKTNASYYNIKLEHGVYVADLVAGGPADRAGLKKTDIIVVIGTKQIESVDDLKLTIDQFKVGDKVDVTVERTGGRMKIPVVLGEAPSQQQQQRR